MKTKQDERADVLRECVTVPTPNAVTQLRANGAAIDETKRAELIERSLRNEHIELELDIVAYVQTPGVMNRKFIRFRAGRLQAIAKTGRNSPFLRNHDQRDVMSAGGTIIASKMVRNSDAREIHQTVRLSVPWAVQAALQGVLGKFSIGWWPRGDVHCSLCQAPIDACLWKLGHWRGSEHDGRIVEFIFQDAELIETSAVNVPAVPEAHARGIRSRTQLDIDKLFALGISQTGAKSSNQGEFMTDRQNMLAQLNRALGLQTQASIEATLAAIDELKTAREKADSSLGLAQSQLADVTAERDAAVSERNALRANKSKLEAAQREQRADAFVTRAIESGKCAANGATASYFRVLYLRDQAAAEETLTAAPTVTPVGAAMQTGDTTSGRDTTAAGPSVPDYARLATQLSPDERTNAERAGVTDEQYVRSNYHSLAAEYGWSTQAR